MNVIGWGRIVPQLVAFFAVLERRPNHLTPFNLFLSGKPGTNKTEGVEELAKFLGHSVALVDTSTLDDVSELAGVVDLRANRESGEARIIAGDLLRQEVLVLDEFLNCRPHVLPQFRLMLQGHLVLMGRKVEMGTRAIIGTGNLSSEMAAGEANLLDSPTADRFAMVVRVPSMAKMSPAEQEAILEGRRDGAFVEEFRAAVDGVREHFADVEAELGGHATRYVRALMGALDGTAFAFEGRRGKLLRSFVLAGLALHRAEPGREMAEVLWAIARDCLTYQRLAGVEFEETELRAAHESALRALGSTGIDDLVAQEATVAGKIRLVLAHLSEVSPVTKADVLSVAVTGSDTALKIALLEAVRHPRFAGEPAELRALVERMGLPRKEVLASPAALMRYAEMSAMEQAAYECTAGDEAEYGRLMHQVREYLGAWGLL